LRPRHGSLIARGLQAALALVAALEKIRKAKVELLGQIQVVFGKIAGTKNGDELSVGSEHRVGTQVRGDFLCLVLKDQSPRGYERMVVGQCQFDGLIKTDQSRGLSNTHMDCQ